MVWWTAGLVGCTQYLVPEAGDVAARAIEDGTEEARGVLAFVNSASATFEVLDLEVPLDRRAAAGIVAHRDGADGILGTADDDPFDTVDELDAIVWVGEAALADLLAYAVANGWVDADVAGTWDGVTLSNDEVTAVLQVANDEDPELLDRKARLDSRAVDAIVAARPIATMDALAALSQVGGEAIEALRHWSVVREDACPLLPDFRDLFFGEWQLEPVVGQYEICFDANEDGSCPSTDEARNAFADFVGRHHSPWCGWTHDIDCGPDPAYVGDCCYSATLGEWCE